MRGLSVDTGNSVVSLGAGGGRAVVDSVVSLGAGGGRAVVVRQARISIASACVV